jgi:hypothetical protein
MLEQTFPASDPLPVSSTAGAMSENRGDARPEL